MIYEYEDVAKRTEVTKLGTEEYIKKRAERGNRDKFLKGLEQVSDNEPGEYDTI